MPKIRLIYWGLLAALVLSGCPRKPWPPDSPRESTEVEKGKLTMLRVHDLGSKFGPPGDQIDVEVVIKLDRQPDKAFGFQLRGESKLSSGKRMFDLLRAAFNNNSTVAIEYRIVKGHQNGIIIHAWLPPPEAVVIEVANVVNAADDPAAQPGRIDPSVLEKAPPPPPDFKDKGGHELFEETQWLPLVEVDLESGEVYNVAVSLTEPALLLARVEWDGSETPIEICVKKDGATLTTGDPYHISPDQGTVLLSVEINSAGNITVEMFNGASATVKAQLIVGKLALSFSEK